MVYVPLISGYMCHRYVCEQIENTTKTVCTCQELPWQPPVIDPTMYGIIAHVILAILAIAAITCIVLLYRENHRKSFEEWFKK